MRGSLELSVGSKIQFVKFKAKTLFEFVQNSKNGVPFCWTTSFPDRKLISIHSKLVSFPWNIINISGNWFILDDSGRSVSRVQSSHTTYFSYYMSHRTNFVYTIRGTDGSNSVVTLVVIFKTIQRFDKISEIFLFEVIVKLTFFQFKKTIKVVVWITYQWWTYDITLSFEYSSVIRGGEKAESPHNSWKQSFLHSNQSFTEMKLSQSLIWIIWYCSYLRNSVTVFEKSHYPCNLCLNNQFVHY